MVTTELKTIKIEADEGNILTDGKIYGTTIFLGSDRSVDEFREITIEEYEKILDETNVNVEAFEEIEVAE